MERCANCEETFKEKPDKMGYYRYSLETKIPKSEICAREILSNLTDVTFTPVSKKRSGQYLCLTCWGLICDGYKYKNAMETFWGRSESGTYIGYKRTEKSFSTPTAKMRSFATSTPKQGTSARRGMFRKSSTIGTRWDPIITNVRNRKYSAAIRGLYWATPGTKRHFHKVVRSIVRKEIKQLLQCDDFPLCQDATISNISNFSWNDTLRALGTLAPLTHEIIRGMLTSKDGDATMSSRGNKNLKPVIGCALATLLYAKSPRKANFLQNLFSIQLWRGGLKRDTLKQVSNTGICLGYKGTVAAIDRIRKSFDDVATFCKEQLTVQLSQPQPVHNETVDSSELEMSIDLSRVFPNVEEEEYIDESDTEQEATETLEEIEADEDDDDDEEDEEEDEEHEGEEDEEEEEGEEEIQGLKSLEEEMELDALQPIISDVEMEESHELEQSVVDDTLHPGFTLCWDNVGKKVVTRHPTPDTKNVYINMALGYMSINRVPVTHLEAFISQKKASDIHPTIFVPDNGDYEELRYRMVTIVGRILTRHLSWFAENLGSQAVPHIVHPHSTEMRSKSVIVNLGVFEENPSSTQGAIGIYRRLQQYIPDVNGKPYPAVIYGDGLSCERGNDARKAVCNGLNPWERLEGLEPSAQEFHKEMLLLQDHFDEFFKGSSATDRGTLYHIRNVFNFRSVKNDIGNCFSDAWELMCLVTESFVCELAMEKLGMEGTSDRPQNARENIENDNDDEKAEYLKDTAQMLTDFLCFKLDTDALLKDDGDGTEMHCCNEDIDEDYVGCGAGPRCAKGQWFHYSCAGLDPDQLPEEFFCSEECRNLEGALYQYCSCKRDLGEFEPMVGCAAGSSCTKYEWYHVTCLGLSMEDLPKGDWFCSDACKELKKSKGKRRSKQKDSSTTRDDFKLEYSRAMTWRGLNLLCRRDAVREGDGEAMMRYWKYDLVNFFARKHPKYIILAHRILCATNGWLPEKIQEEIIWNRTVNYSGGVGRNLPMDLMNEILNRLFKGLLEGAKGRYTDETIQRCGQIIGPLGEALDMVFDEKIIENAVYRHRRRSQNRDSNVKKLISLIQKEKLFSSVPDRQHRAFPGFCHTENPKYPDKFLPKMKLLSSRLDKTRDIILDQ